MTVLSDNVIPKNAKAHKSIKLVVYHSLAAIMGRLSKNRFKEIDTFCLFIGHGRSGHSVVGALLDAHPNIVISDEADSMGMLLRGFTREQILSALILKSQWQAYRKRTKSGLGEKKYSYWVPGQWQGKYQKLIVVGDSKAGITVDHLEKNPGALEQFKSLLQLKLKIILVLRNPYDNISTMVLRGGLSVEKTAENYFKKFETIKKISDQIDPKNLIVIRHEELIEQPRETLKKANDFLGIESFDDYLDACANIIFKSPSKTRKKISWDEISIKTVKENIDALDYLSGYSYEG